MFLAIDVVAYVQTTSRNGMPASGAKSSTVICFNFLCKKCLRVKHAKGLCRCLKLTKYWFDPQIQFSVQEFPQNLCEVLDKSDDIMLVLLHSLHYARSSLTCIGVKIICYSEDQDRQKSTNVGNLMSNGSTIILILIIKSLLYYY